MRTRSVDKFLSSNYLKKAIEFNSTAGTALEAGMYNAAAANAVHKATSATFIKSKEQLFIR